jgi:hypothetical protein
MRYGEFLGGFLLLLGALPASAGVVVTGTQTNLSTHQSNPVTAYIEPDRLKVVMPDATVIYRADLNRMWAIQPERRTYNEITAETMQQMGTQLAGAQSQMAAAQAQLQAGLAQMSPEQRAMIEKMLASRGIGAAGLGAPTPPGPPQVAYTRSGTKTVSGFSCDQYRKTVNGIQQEDLCIARLTATGLRNDDFQVLDRVASFVQPIASSPLMPRTDLLGWTEMTKAIGYEGIPVETVIYGGGAPASEQTVNKIERVAIPANAFDLPSGLTKQDLSAIARGLR